VVGRNIASSLRKKGSKNWLGGNQKGKFHAPGFKQGREGGSISDKSRKTPPAIGGELLAFKLLEAGKTMLAHCRGRGEYAAREGTSDPLAWCEKGNGTLEKSARFAREKISQVAVYHCQKVRDTVAWRGGTGDRQGRNSWALEISGGKWKRDRGGEKLKLAKKRGCEGKKKSK